MNFSTVSWRHLDAMDASRHIGNSLHRKLTMWRKGPSLHTSTLALLRSSLSSSEDDWRSSSAFATKRSDRFQASVHEESRRATARPRTTNARRITTGNLRSLRSCFAQAWDAAAPPTLKTSCKNSSVALFGPCWPPRCFAAASRDVDPRKSLSKRLTPFCARYCKAATLPREAAD